MISRFFKKKSKTVEPKKSAPEKPKKESPKAKVSPPERLLTAEGWKRMMMRKSSKTKK